ncbi:hypothetical protein [Leptolyngbya ohadii]|uniref:hypothetical protein n=1 Tax=Leptolyngbya ohadii TaxID=1962290 RepID=UPI0015C61B4F|nr:hypothetical protein [Leptolyngbya ohadii]
MIPPSLTHPPSHSSTHPPIHPPSLTHPPSHSPTHPLTHPPTPPYRGENSWLRMT